MFHNATSYSAATSGAYAEGAERPAIAVQTNFHAVSRCLPPGVRAVATAYYGKSLQCFLKGDHPAPDIDGLRRPQMGAIVSMASTTIGGQIGYPAQQRLNPYQRELVND